MGRIDGLRKGALTQVKVNHDDLLVFERHDLGKVHGDERLTRIRIERRQHQHLVLPTH